MTRFWYISLALYDVSSSWQRTTRSASRVRLLVITTGFAATTGRSALEPFQRHLFNSEMTTSIIPARWGEAEHEQARANSSPVRVLDNFHAGKSVLVHVPDRSHVSWKESLRGSKVLAISARCQNAQADRIRDSFSFPVMRLWIQSICLSLHIHAQMSGYSDGNTQGSTRLTATTIHQQNANNWNCLHSLSPRKNKAGK